MLELMVVTAIMVALAAAIAASLAAVVSDAKVSTAIEEMNYIKTAVTDNFYSDLGFVPQDAGVDGLFISSTYPSAGEDDRPWFATRFLCLSDDRSDTTSAPEADTDPQAYAMWLFLRAQLNRPEPDDADTMTSAMAKLTWDRYRQKGWKGPYMEYDQIVKLSTDDTVAMPLIGTPWVDTCEEMALEAEDNGNYEEAEEIRRGKYYLIVADNELDSSNEYVTDTSSTRIISFGADCVDSGSYEKTDTTSGQVSAVTAEDLRKMAGDSSLGSDYYDTGDDIVIFIFGGGATRQPSSD